jgi:hypothetical protein
MFFSEVIMFRISLPLVFAAFIASTAAAQAPTTACDVPDNMTVDQKIPCVRAATFALDQPTLTPTQLTNGPDFDASQPDKSRFLYFTESDNVTCYFRPHYAFMKIKGDSMKFQCWHMAPDGSFYNHKGEPIHADAVKVVISSDKGGEKSASLFPAADTTNQHEIKADHFKVKYLKPPFPNHDTRFNEVFTEVAASRIMWVLGFPADHVYPVGSAACIGCTADPFTANLTENKASLKDPPTAFKVVSAEREAPYDKIDPGGDETWSWSDAAKFYSDGTWSRQQRIQYDAYRLALGLIHYHNAISQQNRLVCAEWAPPPAAGGKSKTCQHTMIFVQDLGSTFGKAKGAFDVFGQNPRGDFGAWEPQTVFENAAACELRDKVGGDNKVLKEAQDFMIQRLSRLNPESVKSIFRVARFQMMDQKQLHRLSAAGGSDPAEAALTEWTTTFLKRIEEIRTAQNCKPN